MDRDDPPSQRQDMVQRQIAARGVRDPLVLQALRKVPREAFVPQALRDFAYDDGPLPIGEDQSISQPYIVALMTEALGLGGGECVLEIGTGCGYAAAVLACIAQRVISVERLPALAAGAAARLGELGFGNVLVKQGDGSLGWAELAPYDAIVVAAGGPSVPAALKAQLKIGARLVMPVGSGPGSQELLRLTKVSPTRFNSANLGAVRFVPLLGAQGWAP